MNFSSFAYIESSRRENLLTIARDPLNIYTTTWNNSRFFSPRIVRDSMPIYQCKPTYSNLPQAASRRDREFKNASCNFFCHRGGGGGDAPPPSASKSAKYLFSFDGRLIRTGSFVSRAARLFRTGMKINYFVNSCVTLAVTGPSL